MYILHSTQGCSFAFSWKGLNPSNLGLSPSILGEKMGKIINLSEKVVKTGDTFLSLRNLMLLWAFFPPQPPHLASRSNAPDSTSTVSVCTYLGSWYMHIFCMEGFMKNLWKLNYILIHLYVDCQPCLCPGFTPTNILWHCRYIPIRIFWEGEECQILVGFFCISASWHNNTLNVLLPRHAQC